MGNLSKVLENQERKKAHITQFKIEFLVPFTGCRKVPRKMPVTGKHLSWSHFLVKLQA